MGETQITIITFKLAHSTAPLILATFPEFSLHLVAESWQPCHKRNNISVWSD